MCWRRLTWCLVLIGLMAAAPAAAHERKPNAEQRAAKRAHVGESRTRAGVADAVSVSDSASIGQWSGPFEWPLVAIHATLLRTGHVLVMDDHTEVPAGAKVWDPVTGVFSEVPMTSSDLYCSGHSALPDGRILVTGGHTHIYVGIPDVTIFDPDTRTWSLGPPMQYGRWYPTNTTLRDGRVLVLSGSVDCAMCIADVPELYDPVTRAWTSMPALRLALPLYPHMFLLPDGRVLAASTQEDPIPTLALDLEAGAWRLVDLAVRDGGSSAMYRPGKIIKSGTARNPDYPPGPAVATTYVLDMTQPSPAWRETAPMAFPRTQHNLTLLPDGNVLASGGSRNSDVFDLGGSVYEAELWSPDTETWTTVARTLRPRLYHSTALLLPDGRVLTAGGGRFGFNELNAEVYSPPYLFKGTRPIITAAPAAVHFNRAFTVTSPDASDIGMVSLLRLGSVTHAFNMEQRFLSLGFSAAGRALTIHSPVDGNSAPPGHYMLFLVDRRGVPSLAAFVEVSAEAPPPLTVGATAPSVGASVDLYGIAP